MTMTPYFASPEAFELTILPKEAICQVHYSGLGEVDGLVQQGQ